MSVKTTVYKKLVEDVISPLKKTGEWKVLILDKHSTRIVSSCIKMHEVTNLGITLVENILRKREKLPFEAIYIIAPTEQSVNHLIDDFKGTSTQYSAAHVFFTEVCPEELFTRICQSNCARFVLSLKEINIAYLPHESRVFSLDLTDNIPTIFDCNNIQTELLSRLAKQLATVCATLGEYPTIRYSSTLPCNVEFARLLRTTLEAYKADDESFGSGPFKDRSQLIILDRGFDPISPILHELNFQAMAYDLLKVKHDIYKYSLPGGQSSSPKELILDESDSLWNELRHEHIAVVLKTVPVRLKSFIETKRISISGTSAQMTPRDLSIMLKKLPQYQKELGMYINHMSLAEHCFKAYNENSWLEKFIKVEQDLVMGVDAHGEVVKDPLHLVAPLLTEHPSLNVKTRPILLNHKLRLILLYTILRGGVNKSNFEKLLETAGIHASARESIYFWANSLGLNLFSSTGQPSLVSSSVTSSKRPQPYRMSERRPREKATPYDTARWTPYLKDLLEDACNDKLDSRQFPYLGNSGAQKSTNSQPLPMSARYGQWHKELPGNQKQTARNGPRLIFFILGGMTHSEMRCAYEIGESMNTRGVSSNGLPFYEVILGGTHVCTSETYVDCIMNKNLMHISPSSLEQPVLREFNFPDGAQIV